ncbi:membrane protein-like protein [Cellulomonas flavigena DSM 20109]|uniref:Membrane protein-like protein n=1 Tax=Cellulomonas flavigena (strain ATCC 482 / DSM 20109 / BCRC 11376 / JCM 18109 / NBRC 3775 / NCIMB 8073 / NRS 134) TaxID=446466 RepID=D5UGY9_CELFN|nr:hypothetical protein [Cellulomonas flavigena]ADG73192.1 membrane protein-like protein [Cellulomonas flavigena DSM 20109]
MSAPSPRRTSARRTSAARRTALRRAGAGTLGLPLALLLAVPASAAGPLAAASGDVVVTNTETVQARMDADGRLQVARVYDQLAFSGTGTTTVVNPVSTRGLRNLDGFGGYTVRDDALEATVTVDGKQRLRTVSDFTGELPVKIEVDYRLDGEKVSAGAVVGRSGTLEVRYTVTNLTTRQDQVTYDDGTGRQATATAETVIPFVGQLTTTLPPSFTAIESAEANMAGDGRGGTRMSYTMTLFPPIGSPVAEFGYTAKITGGRIPAANVSVLPVSPLTSPSFKGGSASYEGGAESGIRLTEGATEIDGNLLKLRDGAATLLDGLLQLQEGADKLAAGLNDTAAPGATRLADGLTKDAAPGAARLAGALDGELAPGAARLADGLTKDAVPGAARLAGALDGELAPGAARLADGLTQDAVPGAGRLAAGLNDELAPGAAEIAAGLAAAHQGAGAVAAGTHALDEGATALAAGAEALDAGMTSAGEAVPELLGGLTLVSDGLATMDAGLEKMYTDIGGVPTQAQPIKDGITRLQGGVTALLDGLTTLQGLQGQLAAVYGVLGSTTAVVTVATDAQQMGALAQLFTGLAAQTSDPTQKGQFQQLATLYNPTAYAAAPTTPVPLAPAFTGLAGVTSNVVTRLEAARCGLSNTVSPSCPLDQTGEAKAAGLREGLAMTDGGLDLLTAGVVASVRAAVGVEGQTAEDETLRGGIASLTAGVGELSTGGQALVDGLGELSAGAAELRDGSARLSVGAGTLADGAADLAAGTGRLAPGAQRLSAGLRDAADGSQTLADRLRPAAEGSAALSDGVRAAADGALTLADRLRPAADGSRALADGARTAADGATKLSSGIRTAADGSRELSDGLRDAADGSQTLADGVGTAAEGAPALVDGATRLSQEGTSVLVETGAGTAADYGVKYAVIKAGAERAATESMAYGGPEGATSVTAYSIDIAAADGAGASSVGRGIAAAALFGIGGIVAGFARGRFV